MSEPPPWPAGPAPSPALPSTGATTAAAPGEIAAPRWYPLGRWSTVLSVMLGATAVLQAGLFLALLNQRSVADDIAHGDVIGAFERARDSDDLVRLLSVLTALLFFATAVVFVAWLWRAARDREVLGRGRARFGPGWAIAGCCIPVANLVIPVLLVQDLWRSTAPPGAGDAPPPSGLVATWWTALVVATVGRWVAAWKGNSDITGAAVRNAFRTANAWAIVGALASMVGALLAVAVVRSLTRRVEQSYAAAYAPAAASGAAISTWTPRV